jgi:UDP-N-acetylglucosamine:LPS N-acetylglucosamine transferase
VVDFYTDYRLGCYEYKSLPYITAKELLGIQVITHNNQGGKLYKSLPHITAKVLLVIQVITHNNQGGKLYKSLPYITAKVLLGIQVITHNNPVMYVRLLRRVQHWLLYVMTCIPSNTLAVMCGRHLYS